MSFGPAKDVTRLNFWIFMEELDTMHPKRSIHAFIYEDWNDNGILESSETALVSLPSLGIWSIERRGDKPDILRMTIDFDNGRKSESVWIRVGVKDIPREPLEIENWVDLPEELRQKLVVGSQIIPVTPSMNLSL